MQIIDKQLLDKIPAILKNKFFLVAFVYFIYLLFISDRNLISQFKLAKQLRQLNKEEQYYTKAINDINQERTMVLSNIQNIEKFARENYWMKKDSEDVYIFVAIED
ncbi:MAG: septum formation initiator family protein [Chitinophagales bacterium]|nr:septum formation initiator family protein [Chitinophagales bacterium]